PGSCQRIPFAPARVTFLSGFFSFCPATAGGPTRRSTERNMRTVLRVRIAYTSEQSEFSSGRSRIGQVLRHLSSFHKERTVVFVLPRPPVEQTRAKPTSENASGTWAP